MSISLIYVSRLHKIVY